MALPEDLTGRARIRDAALSAFAEDGDAASIRGIAKRAGCSPALVQHHFGTKDGLRSACDDYIVAYFREQVEAGIDNLGITDPDYLAEVYRSAPIVIGYLNRCLVENTPKAQRIFDSLVELTEPYLRTDAASAVRDRAAVLVAMKLGLLLLRPHGALGAGLWAAVHGSALRSSTCSTRTSPRPRSWKPPGGRPEREPAVSASIELEAVTKHYGTTTALTASACG